MERMNEKEAEETGANIMNRQLDWGEEKKKHNSPISAFIAPIVRKCVRLHFWAFYRSLSVFLITNS